MALTTASRDCELTSGDSLISTSSPGPAEIHLVVMCSSTSLGSMPSSLAALPSGPAPDESTAQPRSSPANVTSPRWRMAANVPKSCDGSILASASACSSSSSCSFSLPPLSTVPWVKSCWSAPRSENSRRVASSLAHIR